MGVIMGWECTYKRYHSSLASIYLVGALFPGLAGAVALAPISLQSLLGQNLVAEIDVLNLTPQEAASLKATMAGPGAWPVPHAGGVWDQRAGRCDA